MITVGNDERLWRFVRNEYHNDDLQKYKNAGKIDQAAKYVKGTGQPLQRLLIQRAV